jgi:transcriptional regulator with GAF, ATPase, and Fis domain
LFKTQKLYWVFDAPANGFFNEEELKIPIQINFSTKYVITNLLKQKAFEKQLLIQDKNIELSASLNKASDQEGLITTFVEFLSGSFEAHKLTIAMVESNNSNMAKVIKSIGQLDSTKAGIHFNLEDGLCGKVIASNKTYMIDDIEKDGYFIPRFTANEQTNYGLRSFLAVPLSINNEAIGMISLEHKSAKAYTKAHKKLLQSYTEYFVKALARFR